MYEEKLLFNTRALMSDEEKSLLRDTINDCTLLSGRCVAVAKLLPSKSESVQVREASEGENTASPLQLP